MSYERTRRSFEPVTDDDLHRLAAYAEAHGRQLRTTHPSWAQTPLVVCLAQGAAAHRVDRTTGVKDFDVWLFYALPPGSSAAHFPWNRHVAHVDFGGSPHGRQLYTEEERAETKYPVRSWEAFRGRRVDLMARTISPGLDSADALGRWLRNGRSGSSAWWLAQQPIIDLREPSLGTVLWPSPDSAA